MRQFGLIGKTLQHSFSPAYFQKKFEDLNLSDCSYKKFELASLDELPLLFKKESLVGCNVTIPYKEEILPYLDDLDPVAKEVGAVNCVHIKQGKTIGYNTDIYGFSQSIKPFLDVNHERALILGTGGAAKAVAYALKKIGVQTFFVSSSPAKKKDGVFLYEDLNKQVFDAFKLIVNTTPLGTWPETEALPSLPFAYLTANHFVYDLIYNPAETQLMKKAKEQGATVMNGLSMLQLQAEKSWEIWTEK
jgi:shikimate dehydrogenase